MSHSHYKPIGGNRKSENEGGVKRVAKFIDEEIHEGTSGGTMFTSPIVLICPKVAAWAWWSFVVVCGFCEASGCGLVDRLREACGS